MVKAALSDDGAPSIKWRPALTAPAIRIVPALRERADAGLEQLGYRQAEEVSDFPQFTNRHAALSADDLADPRAGMAAPNR